jgi:adenylate cyclase
VRVRPLRFGSEVKSTQARARRSAEPMSDDESTTRRLGAALRRLDANPRLLEATRRARDRLPGDARYGDPLSTAGDRAPHLMARQLAALTSERPSVLRELGFGALQLWQGLSEAQGRGFGEHELTIMFADIVEFSSWALEAGDERALELLRAVDELLVSAIDAHGGQVVKRLGDGMMATFSSAQGALDAAHDAHAHAARIKVAGHTPALRVGLHVGRPRKLGGDYFGVDVNVAARVGAAARAGEVLVSDSVPAHLDEERVALRLRPFRAKGAPAELRVYAAEPLPGAA